MSAKEQSQAAPAAASPGAAIPLCVSAWLLPGLGHVMLGMRNRGLAFFACILLMFGMGLFLQGELFPLDSQEPLTFLAGVAEIGSGLPYFAARMLGAGRGNVLAVTYEYGYTFCIVAGLLNMLVVLDVYDFAVGRKPRAAGDVSESDKKR